MKSVLLLGSENDPHLLAVQSGIMRKGIKCFIFDIYNNDHKIVLAISNNGILGEFIFNNEILSFNEISKVWWRIKPNPYIGESLERKAISDYINLEWRTIMNCLYRYLPNALWVNSPESQHKANFKPYQLLLAKKVGFQIPNTVLTNDSNSILNQLRDFDRIIFKQIGWSMFPNGDVIYTNEVEKESLQKYNENVSLAPGIYQELIDKEYELRITVVGSDVLAVRINSQLNESTIIDWRHDQLFSMYEYYKLSDEITKMILEYVSLADLKYGAFDFIKSKTRGYVFLECNPSGQWLWIEEKVDSFCITDSLVKLLT
jgi:hypothetical protein